ncbi:MAG TPA: outer membrane protein assembly factor, partial [Epsilonproteobacteria bacterium]|nr:outer membrane protein assembly factor [Campylobacterota bacterium]
MWQRLVIVGVTSATLLYGEEESKLINAFIQGNKIVETSAIENALEIKRPKMLFFWRDKTPTINTKLIKIIPVSLESFFRSEGFYEARFEIVQNDQNITITIEENRPVKVKTVEVDSDFPIEELIRLKPKDIFRASNFTQTKADIIAQLLLKGYCSYDLDTKAYVDLEAYSAEVVYKLKKGDKCTFGDTNIKGLETIKPKVIHSRLQARKGSRFGTMQVHEMYERLNQLDAFDNIVIRVDRKFFNEIPIDITLKEITKPYYFSGGIGYDTYVGPRVQAQLTKRNFLGNAQKLILTTSYSPKEQVVDIEFFKPAFLNWRHYFVDFGIKGGYSNLDFKEFTEEKLYVKGFLSYLYRRWDLQAGLGWEKLTITPQTGHTIPPQRLGDFTLLYPYFQAIYDARDDKLNPRFGYYLAGYLEYGLPCNTDASDYVKMLFEARRIYSFQAWTFSTVGKIGV